MATFHAFSAFLLRVYGRVLGIDPNFSIFDTTDRNKLVKAACGDAGALPVGLTAAKVGDRIGHAKTRLIGPDQLEQLPGLPEYQRAAIARIYRRYQDLLRENGGLDFDDLLIRGLELLENEEAGEAIRRKYQYLLIDEYQDTNRIQYHLARRLAGERRNICATGDPDQSIYGWRGADLRNILDFQKDYPDAKVVFLEKNYRSTACILKAADSVIVRNRERKEKVLVPVLGQGEPVEVHTLDDEGEEAERVVRIIREAKRDGMGYADVAIFCRVNSLLRAVETSLREAGIPYELARGVGFFQKREIRDLVAYLRVLGNPDDQLALERIINVPTRGIGQLAQSVLKEYAAEQSVSLIEAVRRAGQIERLGKSQASVLRFAELMGRLVKAKDEMGLSEFVKRVIHESGLHDYYQRQSRSPDPDDEDDRPDELSPVANLDELVATAQAFEYDNEKPTLQDFLAQVSLVSDVDTVKTDSDRVTLLTMHAAKGLEFGVVVIVAAEEEIIPHVLAMEDGVEEERRLFFVAMTRAKQRLHICCAHRRATRGSYRRSVPSRFIREIDPKVVKGLDLSSFSRPARNFQFVINPKRTENGASTAAAALPKCSYRSGQRIYHEKFGYGVIEEIYLSGNRYTAGIRFHSAGVKKIVLDLAPIHPVAES